MSAYLLALLLSVGAPGTLDRVRVFTPEVKQYERAEIAFTPDMIPANPFDPKVVALDGVVTLPSGKVLRVPGFWFQDYRRGLQNPGAKEAARIERLRAAGKPEWRLRFSSGEVGVHRIVLELKEASGVRKSAPVEVKVGPGNRRGPIRVSPRNKWYLEDAAGKGYFPIGQNLCMAPEREGTYFFERILPRLAMHGANYVRLWQEYYVQGDLRRPAAPGDGSNTGFPLETVVTGLGKYDLECAWKLDVVSDLCDRHGIGWQLCFEQVVWWNRKLNHRWARNPYNAANGGPCRVPAAYLTDATCRELAARRHRYSVARWGWSPGLVAWEMWNEVDNLDGFTSAANVSWHKDLSGRLRAMDPFKHLVTTSWRDPAMFALPEIDVVQAHSYWPVAYDAALYSRLDTNHLMRPFGKPFFFGEQGMDEQFEFDPEGNVFHAALWSSTLAGAAGTGMHWHWNTYIDRHDLYRHYAPLAKFVRDVDWPAHDWKLMKITRPNQPVSLNVYGLAAADRALVWIHDPLWYRVVKGKVERGPRQASASVNVAGLPQGNYRIEWWDTRTGEAVGTDAEPVRPLRHFGYGIELHPPAFQGDIAARIIRLGQRWR
jgi:hypothetical protein